MACDGEIVQEELDGIKGMAAQGVFASTDVDGQLSALVEQLNTEGKAFLQTYLNEIDQAQLGRDDSLKLLRIAVDTIYLDNDVLYSEVKFFRAVRHHLPAIDDDTILAELEPVEDFWLESDVRNDAAAIEKDYFDNIELPKFNLAAIKSKNKE